MVEPVFRDGRERPVLGRHQVALIIFPSGNVAVGVGVEALVAILVVLEPLDDQTGLLDFRDPVLAVGAVERLGSPPAHKCQGSVPAALDSSVEGGAWARMNPYYADHEVVREADYHWSAAPRRESFALQWEPPAPWELPLAPWG